MLFRSTSSEANPSDPISLVFNYLDTEERHDAAIAWAEANFAADACPWDCDGSADGNANVVDLLALLAAWGPNPGHPADFNGDGVVGTADLLALLEVLRRHDNAQPS